MMTQFKSCLALILALCPVAAHAVFTTATGFVTPNELTIPIRQIELLRFTDSGYVTVWKGEKNLTFRRTDSNFGKTELSSTVVPEGRYIGIRITMSTNFTAVISGAKYRGSSAGTFSDGTTIYSVGTDALSNGSVSTTSGSTTLTGVRQSGAAANDTVAKTSYFPVPVCFSGNGNICASTDYKIVQTGSDRRTGATVTAPELNLIMDMFHALVVDAGNAAVAFGNSYPIPIMGTPGALIHVASTSQTDFTFVFAGDKSIQAIVVNGIGSGASLNGTANVRVSAAPSGLTIPATGELFVASFDQSVSGGRMKFPLSSSGTANCYVDMSGFLNQVGTAASASVDASTTTLSGYTWTMGSSCGSASTGSLSVQRIIDPNNIFGVCSSGLCAASGTDADGYL